MAFADRLYRAKKAAKDNYVPKCGNCGKVGTMKRDPRSNEVYCTECGWVKPRGYADRPKPDSD